MPRRLRTDIPGPDWRVRVEELRDPGLDRLYPERLPRPLALVVDVGFGRGELLLELARGDPGRAYLGIEHSFKRALKVARRLAKSGLDNVRLVQTSAEAVVRELAPRSVQGFWINFPDPWPKKRHHRRRLVQPGFVRELAERLAPGGFLEVATDHAEYAEWIHAVLVAEPLLENRWAPLLFRREPPPRAATAYELEWRAQGRPAHYFSYARAAERAAPPGGASRAPGGRARCGC